MVELGRVSLRINIETQMFKYLQRKPFVNENCNLGKAFNKEVVPNKKSELVHKNETYTGLLRYD